MVMFYKICRLSRRSMAFMRFAFVFVCGVLAVSAEHWNVINPNTNLTCLILDADLSFNLKFLNDTSNQTQSYTADFNQTNNVYGECNAIHKNQSVNHLKVEFYVTSEEPASLLSSWTVEFWFGKPKDSATFQLVDYKLVTTRTAEIPFSGTFERPTSAEAEIQAKDRNAFQCSDTTLGLNNESSIQLRNLRTIAFADLNSTDFPKEQQYELCSTDAKTSKVVPAVVGICLAGLVVIVLVAYLIGRARAKRQVTQTIKAKGK
ncbi:hypothetical protein WR25_18812 [Diploscapter pachys]|uniref:Lysosome-associated membrane glycoprotein 2-like transmembrane domain-containing protein n=1 Tax=Diploscapter pachys TaxID=2018661 RepID=A0A2A2J8X2_9BILA|nr:hypothetical protein WR25_18812 [Diploscapter pachys]